jgi:hypothetical protein
MRELMEKEIRQPLFFIFLPFRHQHFKFLTANFVAVALTALLTI